MKFADYELDLSLLVIFQTLMKFRNVTQTAKHLDLSQPAVSRKLAKLREHFNDNLFVKTGRGLVPTPYATDIEPFVNRLVRIYQTQIYHHEKFVPELSERSFAIASSEVGHSILLPGLMRACAAAAPRIRLHAVRPSTNTLMQQLENGEVDVALGGYPKLYAGIYEKTLATESYLCAVRSDHPDLGGQISFADFTSADHVIISTKGLGHVHRQIEKQIYEVCPKERIRLVSDSFFSAALLVEQTDCIAILPARLATFLGKRLRLRFVEPPVNIANFDIKLYWHERFHQAPANQWLRRMIGGVIH
ncbi:MAG: LysR substrate-binding domain-containing protein [Pseudomonadota bacterium]